MATAGTLIKQANFSTSWAREYQCPTTKTKDQNLYVYVCAPAWYLIAKANYGVFGSSGIFRFNPAYWNGSSWVETGTVAINGAEASFAKYFAHNRDEGNLNYETYHSAYPLWRIKYWPSRANNNWSLKLYVGGWGVAINTSTGALFNYPLGKKIRSIGRSGDCIHDAGTTDDGTNVVNNIFNPVNRRGSPILASNDKELVYYPYLD